MEPSPNPPYSGFVGYLHTHPIFLLLLLTPGIPEYLSGSTKMSVLASNPIAFLILLSLNLGLYGPGVLLIREAVLRWKKGWASLILLGACYAIFEEGFALRTIFTDSAGNPVGNLAVYGRWLGVNWVWTPGILIVHIVFSISLPIMFFGLTFPDLKSKSMVSESWKIGTLLLILLVDAFTLQRIVGYQPSAAIDLLTIIAMLGLIVAARKMPANLLHARTLLPSRSSRVFAVLGFSVTPVMILVGGIGSGANWPPAGTVALIAFLSMLLVLGLQRFLGSTGNERQKVALAIGLIVPIALFGILVGFALPVVASADIWMALYLRGLWKNYSSRIYEPLRIPLPTPTAG